jgi:hypothetical protein
MLVILFVCGLGAAMVGIFVYALRPDKPAKPGEWYSSI